MDELCECIDCHRTMPSWDGYELRFGALRASLCHTCAHTYSGHAAIIRRLWQRLTGGREGVAETA